MKPIYQPSVMLLAASESKDIHFILQHPGMSTKSYSTFNVYGSVHHKYIPIYISKKMQLYTVYLYLKTALHVSLCGR